MLRLLAASRSNQRIARNLVLALDTVNNQVSHVLRKLGAANRTEAAAQARQLGLIPDTAPPAGWAASWCRPGSTLVR